MIVFPNCPLRTCWERARCVCVSDVTGVANVVVYECFLVEAVPVGCD